MKSVILALCIFIIIIVLIVTSYFYMTSLAEEVLAMLEKARELVTKNEWELADTETKRLYNVWEKNRTPMSVLTNHTILDEIDYAISRVETSIRLEDFKTFRMESNVLELKIQDLKEHQKISVSNLF